MIGLEPITCWLQISCSANWATSAYSVFTCFIAQLAEHKLRLSAHLLLTRSISLNWATSAYVFFLLRAARKFHFPARKMTPRGFEPLLPPWKGGVLTAWPWSQIWILISRSVLHVHHILLSSPSRARTYNTTVNSRVLYHWAIEEYWSYYTFKTAYSQILNPSF